MLLIAGLLGIVASGLMFVIPGHEADDEDAASHEAEAGAEEADAVDTSSPLTEAFAPEEVQSPQQTPPADQAAEGAATETAETDSALQEEPKWDQVAGAHLSDAIGGSTGHGILHQNDAMFGNIGDDDIAGGEASDLIIGNDGNDTLDGGADRDGLYGDAGDDVLNGGVGDDVLSGGWGNDSLDGGADDDLLTGGDGNDTLDGGIGNDRLFGMSGQDVMLGHLGNDLLDGTQAENGAPHDQDEGDWMDGGDGDDTLAADRGDTLIGGAGADLFLFRAPSAGAYFHASDDSDLGPAYIADFDAGEDAIEILYDPKIDVLPGQQAPAVTINEGLSGPEVLLNGAVVAKLAAGTQISASHVLLIPSP